MLEGLKPPPHKAWDCRVRAILEKLETSDQEILKTALEDLESWPAKTLSKALRERGITLADTTITKHRQLLCQCGKAPNA